MTHVSIFFFNDTATTEIYTLSLHDALPIWREFRRPLFGRPRDPSTDAACAGIAVRRWTYVRGAGLARRHDGGRARSEEHTSELQSRQYLVCRLLLEKKKTRFRAVSLPLPAH